MYRLTIIEYNKINDADKWFNSLYYRSYLTNEVTIDDKSKISDSTIQNTKSSVTLVRGSTGNAGVLLPFWNEYTREESKKWWLSERFEFNYLFALIY